MEILLSFFAGMVFGFFVILVTICAVILDDEVEVKKGLDDYEQDP